MAYIGHGITLTIGSKSWLLRDVAGPTIQRTMVESMHMGITDKHMTYLLGLIDTGEVTLTVIHEPSTTSPITESDTLETVTITYPTTPVRSISGQGCISRVSPRVSLGQLATQEITIKASGKWTAS